MFLSNGLEKCGVFDYLAPRDEKFGEPSLERRGSRIDTSNMTGDEKLAWELQKEEHYRYRCLHAQYASEMKARTFGILAPNQRVSYNNKGEVFDATVLDVHLDDGPDKPYYTIRYKKRTSFTDENGEERETVVEVEKQTDHDRLERIEWDEDAAFEELQKTKSTH